jgi:tRNA(Ile)-lysidine synthase
LATADRRPFSRLPIVRRVERFCRTHSLLPSGALILAAVSGGADSVFLARALTSLAPVFGVVVHVAHFNHRWRGAESDGDALFVERLSGALGVPFHGGSADVRSLQRRERRSPEEAARAARYRFLAQTAHATGAQSVAVGHSLDDQMETYLLGWLRGSGPGGLLMPVSAPLPVPRSPVRVVRPLLAHSGHEIRQALEREGIEWREDSSNEDLSLLRNRVRHELVPLLESLAPGFRRTVVRSAQLIELTQRYVGDAARYAADRAFRHEGDELIAQRVSILSLAPALRAPALLEAVTRLCGSDQDVEAAHLEAAVALIARGAGGRTTPLGPNASLSLQCGMVTLARRAPAAAPPEPG